MLMRSSIALLACLVLATVGWAAPVTEPPRELKDALPIGGALPLGERVWHARIEVPEDAMRLAVMVSADRDIDVFLTHGAPPTGDVSSDADASSSSPAPHEVVAVSTTSEPRLEAGTWYVSIQNPFPQSTSVEFEVVAFVDRRDVERTMLAGDGATLRFSTPSRPTVFRTYLPQRALQAVLDLDPAPPGGFLYTVRGPQEFVRRGRSRQGQLVFDATEAPPGGYLISLVPAVRAARPVASAARLSVSFEGGTTLPMPPNPVLRPDDPVPVLLGGTARSSIQRFRIEVPSDTRGFVVEAANARGADVDIFVRRGTPTRIEDEDAQWLGISTSPLERVVVAGEEPLRRGIYHAEVVLLENDRPVEVVVTLRQLDPDDDVCTWGHELPALLEPDVWMKSAVKVDLSGVRWHAIRVPEGSRSLHLQLLDASGPLELLVARPADGSVLARSFSSLVDEHLGVSFPAPLTADRILLAGVLNRATWDPDVRYRIAAGIDRRPTLPEDLVWPPVHDLEDLTIAERIAAATVEITIGDCSGGSGICVSPDGLIVSCRHCLQLADGTGRVQRDRILVAFSPDLRRAAHPDLLRQDRGRGSTARPRAAKAPARRVRPGHGPGVGLPVDPARQRQGRPGGGRTLGRRLSPDGQ